MLAAKLLSNNKKKKEIVYRVLNDLLSKVTKQDFFGSATVEIVVQGGSIQDIKERTEQNHR